MSICGFISYSFNNLIDLTRDFFNRTKPYHPSFAAGAILGYFYLKNRHPQKEISVLEKRVRALEVIHRERKNCTKALSLHKKKLRMKKFEKFLSFLQLGSLLFPHPGSNPWSSLHGLVGRFVPFALFRQEAKPGTLSALCSLGAIASLLQQMGFVEEQDPLCGWIVNLSLIALGFERRQAIASSAKAALSWIKKIGY